MMFLLWRNLLTRWRERVIWFRELRGELYPVVAHKRDRWAPMPTPKRDSLARLLRYRQRLANERKRVETT